MIDKSIRKQIGNGICEKSHIVRIVIDHKDMHEHWVDLVGSGANAQQI
jgi:hypothetical protein